MKIITFKNLQKHLGHKLECQQTDKGVSVTCKSCNETLIDDLSELYFVPERHIGHEISCVLYGDIDISIECEDCYEVLYDIEVGQCPFQKLYGCECDGDEETFTSGDCGERDVFAELSKLCPKCSEGILSPTLSLTMACDKCSYERTMTDKEL